MAAERPGAAVRWFEELVDKTPSLALFPGMGRMVPEAQRTSLRELLVKPYRVIYRRDESEVIILAVHHAHRELGVEEVAP